MTELHVEIPDDLVDRLAERSRAEHTTPEALTAAAVRSFLYPRRVVGFANLGASGTHDTARRIEEIMRAELSS